MKKILGILLTDTHLKEENIEVNKQVYEQAVQFCKDNNLNAIFHLSDIFNSRKAQSQQVLVDGFDSILDSLQANGIRMITFPGNHDKTSYDSRKSFLRPFKHHPSFSLYEEHTIVEYDNLYVHLIPFFSNERYIQQLEKSRRIAEGSREGVKHILFTHIGVHGARMNNGQEVDGIPHSYFEHFEKVFIGHYHDKQIFGKFNYIGASIQHNFGETPDKGLTVLYDDLSWETIVLDTPKYQSLQVDVSKLDQKSINEIIEEASKSDDRLRVVLIGDESQVKSVQKKALQDAGVKVEMKVNSVEKKEIEDRVEPFSSSSLKQEFHNFCEKNGLDVEEGLKYLTQVLQ